MIEGLKELIRRIIWILPIEGEFKADKGSLKCRFLEWLYGNGEPEFDITWPDEN